MILKSEDITVNNRVELVVLAGRFHVRAVVFGKYIYIKKNVSLTIAKEEYDEAVRFGYWVASTCK